MNGSTHNPQAQAAAAFIDKVRGWTKPMHASKVTVQDILDMVAEGWLKPDDVLFQGDEP